MVILYDAECGFCGAGMRFVQQRQPGGARFLARNSAEAAPLLERFGKRLPESVIVVRSGRYFTESDAVLELIGSLPWPWRGLGWLRVIPRPVRDRVYRWVAARRHRLGSAACPVR